MKLLRPTPIIKAVLVAVIVGFFGWLGLDIPQGAVEETVEAQLDEFTSSTPDTGTGASSVTYVVSNAAEVTRVIDGDTVDVVIDDEIARLRFIGIDTPETEFSPTGAECYGREASQYAVDLLDGTTVTLYGDSSQNERDVHGRLLVYAELPDGRDVGEVLLRAGYAREYTFINPYANQATYQAAQASAVRSEAGLWAACSG